jgi:hypothetical protein
MDERRHILFSCYGNFDDSTSVIRKLRVVMRGDAPITSLRNATLRVVADFDHFHWKYAWHDGI